MEKDRSLMHRLMAEAASSGDAVLWFEKLYQQSGDNLDLIPWADLEPNPQLIEWFKRENPDGKSRSALDVGCGLGDNAEHVAQHGFTVTAFDVAPGAVAWCRKRFPASNIRYLTASVLALPHQWSGAFDFVHECYTLQTLPEELRLQAMSELARCVKPGGTLLIICRGRDDGQAYDKTDLPWPLSRTELNRFETMGFSLARYEDFMDMESTPKRRIRAEYRKNDLHER